MYSFQKNVVSLRRTSLHVGYRTLLKKEDIGRLLGI